MRILLFAGLAEACGARILELPDPPPAAVGDLRRAAAVVHAGLRERVFRVAVNGRYAEDTEPLPLNAEVAFLPPVSGG